MKKYFKSSQKNLVLLVFFTFVLFILLVLIKSRNGMILFSDLNFFLFTKEGFWESLYVWNDNQYGHYTFNNIIMAPFLGVFKGISYLFGIYITSNINFFGLYFGIFLSSIYLIYKINKKRDFIDYLIIAIYSVANPLIFSLHGQTDMAYSLIFVNLFLGYLFGIKNEFGVKDASILTLILLFCNFYVQTSLLLLFSVFLFFILFQFQVFKRNKKGVIFFVVLFVLLNLFWLIFLGYQFVTSEALNSSLGYNPSSVQGIGIVDLMSSITKTFSPFMLSHFFIEDRDNILYFYSSLYGVSILTGVIIFIVFCSFFCRRQKEKNERKLILSLLSIYLVFFIFSLGNKVYFREVFMFFWNYVPFFDLYRSIHKFLFPLYFTALILFAFSLNKIREWKKLKILILILIAPLLFSFFQKDFLQSINNYKIPDYYWEISKKVSKSKEDSNIKIIPETNWYTKFVWNPNNRDSCNIAPYFIDNKRTSYNYTPYSLNTFELRINEEISQSLSSCHNNRNISKLLSIMNFRNVLLQKDVVLNESNKCFDNITSSELDKDDKESVLSLYALRNDFFLPHFYSPEYILVSNRNEGDFSELVSRQEFNVRSAIFFSYQNRERIIREIRETKPLNVKSLPVLEYKKINPTKYRIRVHGSSDTFPLIFSENFHAGWKAYLVEYSGPNLDLTCLSKYRIFDGNEKTQATKKELIQYIKDGQVSTLGDHKKKNIAHYALKNNENISVNNEKNEIDYISKNFHGTVQNENLYAGNIFETWFKEPLNENMHAKVNGYANSWLIEDPDVLCSSSNICQKNSDGSFDFELIVEFWPQRLFYIGFSISFLVFLACVTFLSYDYLKKIKTSKS